MFKVLCKGKVEARPSITLNPFTDLGWFWFEGEIELPFAPVPGQGISIGLGGSDLDCTILSARWYPTRNRFVCFMRDAEVGSAKTLVLVRNLMRERSWKISGEVMPADRYTEVA